MVKPSPKEVERYQRAYEIARVSEQLSVQLHSELDPMAFQFTQNIDQAIEQTIDGSGPGVRRLLAIARVIGFEALATIIANSRKYVVARKPRPRADAHWNDLLSEEFVSRVLELDEVPGSLRRQSLSQAAEEVLETARLVYRDDPAKLRNWLVVEHRGLEKRFNASVDRLRNRHGFLRGPRLATLGAAHSTVGGMPRHSLENTKARRGRKKRTERTI